MDEYSNRGYYNAQPPGVPQIIFMHAKKRRKWPWIALAAVIFCACVAGSAIALASTGSQSVRIEGNAGVVAAYDFLCEIQQKQDSLTGPLSREISDTLMQQPFEMEAQLEMSSDAFSDLYLPFSSIEIELDAKYDEHDLGVKMRALGMELAGAYIIGDEFVLDVGGRTGSVKISEAESLDAAMTLKDRIGALVPFLPQDKSLYITLLEKLAQSVSDEYTTSGHDMALSPKDGDNVRMETITTILDAEAIRDIAGEFAENVNEDRTLSRDVQDIIDGFTELIGVDNIRLRAMLDDIVIAADSKDLDGAEIKWTVFKRDDSYAGISVNVSVGEIKIGIEYMAEFEGNEMFVSEKADIDGTVSDSTYHYAWSGDKVDIDGQSTQTDKASGSNSALFNGSIEFGRDSKGRYSIEGVISMNGDILGDSYNTSSSISMDMDIDVMIETGDSLDTLKESREWKGIYDEEWGKLEDMFNWEPSVYGGFDLGQVL